ncbi:MAG: sigma 54 modulation/S30EA ribosomal C-terminal domain-containing protein, partial [Clostridia bacterium]|nr:sigma 54 modulation/S30EA ribosomal C-terminal domain-containing protein [Clostridia bacterium]
IIRTKKITAKPMTVEEAVLQMNMLEHDFYIFRTTEGKICVAYKRHDGGYGLIETE